MRDAVAAAGFPPGAEPGLRPTGIPGQYAASVARTLGGEPRETARRLAAPLADAAWIEKAEVTGPGYLTITVTAAALAAVADRIAQAGPGCAVSDALAGVAVPAAPPGGPAGSATWEEARAALALLLTARLAAAAGARAAVSPAPVRVNGDGNRTRARGQQETAAGIAAAAVASPGRTRLRSPWPGRYPASPCEWNRR